jgi:hypothetical protein
LTLSPWGGPDPNLAQCGISLVGEGATGDTSTAGRPWAPDWRFYYPSDLRFGLEVGVGTSWGAPPAQKLWYVGGPGSEIRSSWTMGSTRPESACRSSTASFARIPRRGLSDPGACASTSASTRFFSSAHRAAYDTFAGVLRHRTISVRVAVRAARL